MKSGFHAVIGKTDYLKPNDKKIPIWELTEYQPAGWLVSLSIKPEVIPNGAIIHDCGAYSYREQDYPTIRGKYIDAEWAVNRYLERSREGDTVVCPDSLLLGNINWRRQYNLEQAQTFIKIAKEKLTGRIPLAVIHGLSLEEKVEYTLKLYRLGYKYLGIGGLVQQTSDYPSTLYTIKTIIGTTRALDKNVHFHIFGVCAPKYAKVFLNMKNVSFDGSTHARETFSSNCMLFHSGDNIVRYPVYLSPKCSCRACAIARNYKINPQELNNRQASIIRLAHNLNSLLATYHHLAKPKSLHLIAGCGKQTNQTAAAKDVYCSQHFQACHNYAQTQDEWNILSPLHQVLSPYQIISPYNKSPCSLSSKERVKWAQSVARKLIETTNPDVEIVFLTGKLYRQQVIPILQAHGYTTRAPMEGLGIGQQIRWLISQSSIPKQLSLRV